MTRPRWLFLALLVLTPALATGQAIERFPRPYPKQLEHRPRPLPDRIILTWASDPARSQAVTWRTDTTVEGAVAQLARAEAGPHFPARAETFPAVTTPLTTDLGDALYHTVGFANLAPGTKYAYRVGDGINWSEWFHFRTASDRPEPFTFVYLGDAQTDIKSLWSRVVRDAFTDAPKARFVIHAGDLVNDANSDAQWGEWFGAGGWLNAMVPSVPTPGNHEYLPPQQPRELSRHWRPQFALPEHGPPGLEETVYYLDFQGVRIISLNSNEQPERQVTWLEQVLKDNPQPWTVVTFHHPLYSSAGRDNAPLRSLWQPILDRYRVDLVLQGHDHTYARSGLISGENVTGGLGLRDAKSGTVYVVSVSGPKMYGLQRQDWMKRGGQDMQLYQLVTVDGNRLSYEARTATGETHDAFELLKRPDQINELMEKLPPDPEAARKPRNDAKTAVIAAAVAVLIGLVLWMVRAARRAVRRAPR